MISHFSKWCVSKVSQFRFKDTTLQLSKYFYSEMHQEVEIKFMNVNLHRMVEDFQ